MSSIEIQAALKLEPPAAYAGCNTLKNKGLIESRTDEADGTRRYFVVNGR